MGSFVKLKHSQNGEITLSITDVDKSCPSHKFLTWQNMLFNSILENKILTNLTEFIVPFIIIVTLHIYVRAGLPTNTYILHKTH